MRGSRGCRGGVPDEILLILHSKIIENMIGPPWQTHILWNTPRNFFLDPRITAIDRTETVLARAVSKFQSNPMTNLSLRICLSVVSVLLGFFCY